MKFKVGMRYWEGQPVLHTPVERHVHDRCKIPSHEPCPHVVPFVFVKGLPISSLQVCPISLSVPSVLSRTPLQNLLTTRFVIPVKCETFISHEESVTMLNAHHRQTLQWA